MFRVLLLIFGVFCCSTAVLLIKASQTSPVMLASLRLWVAAAALSPVFFLSVRRHRARFRWGSLRMTIMPAVMLAIHFISWIIGARMTPAVNSTLIVNFVPLVMPFLLFMSLRERLTASEIVATVIALGGVGLLCISDFNIDAEYFWGDVICFGSMLALAYYMLLARRNRDFPSLWLYVVPIYFLAAAFCLAAAPLLGSMRVDFSGREVLLIVALGIVPTVFGHSIINRSMQRLRGQVVSIINMGQFIFAGVMAWFVFGERPGGMLYVAAAMIVGGASLVVVQTLRRRPTEEPATMVEESVVLPAGPGAQGWR
jgi:drug/metabolite transporter (DMT)-like permease